MVGDAPEGAIAIDQRLGLAPVGGNDPADVDAVGAGIEALVGIAFEDGGGIGHQRQAGFAVAPMVIGEVEGFALARFAGEGFGVGAAVEVIARLLAEGSETLGGWLAVIASLMILCAVSLGYPTAGDSRS